MFDVTVIGPAVIDILASPVDLDAIAAGSRDLDRIRMSFGGDALNEAVALSRLGRKVRLISKVGDDVAGRRILSYMEENGIPTDDVRVQEGLDTAINIALIEKDGNRKFLMNPHSSLRRLSLEDVLPLVDGMSEIVSFASMFISPLFTVQKMEELFSLIKKSGRRLVVDVTRAKNGETIETIRPLLPYMDVFVPNDEEIASLTGVQDAQQNVRMLVEAGVGTAIVKAGKKGCLVGFSEPQTSHSSLSYKEQNCRKQESRYNGLAPKEDGSGQIRILHVPSVPDLTCVDTTGAGDCFAAGFINGMCGGLSTEECARMGCAAASCSIEEMGAVDGVRDLAQVMKRYSMVGPVEHLF